MLVIFDCTWRRAVSSGHIPSCFTCVRACVRVCLLVATGFHNYFLKIQYSVLQDWLMLRDFTSFVEAYSDGVMSVAVNFAAPPECVIYCHDDFLKVRQSIKDPRAYFHSAFAHSCSAAVMNLGYHKGWSKGMLLPQENSMVVACEIQT